jgi:hypothetical protein
VSLANPEFPTTGFLARNNFRVARHPDTIVRLASWTKFPITDSTGNRHLRSFNTAASLGIYICSAGCRSSVLAACEVTQEMTKPRSFP